MFSYLEPLGWLRSLSVSPKVLMLATACELLPSKRDVTYVHPPICRLLGTSLHPASAASATMRQAEDVARSVRVRCCFGCRRERYLYTRALTRPQNSPCKLVTFTKFSVVIRCDASAVFMVPRAMSAARRLTSGDQRSPHAFGQGLETRRSSLPQVGDGPLD